MTLKTVNLVKRYGDRTNGLVVFDDASYEFPTKGSVAIVGQSGIGKSTLLHLISGIDDVTSGQVIIDEQEVTSLSEDELADYRRDNIGFIFQFHHLLAEFTALENVAMPLFISDIDEDEAFAAATELLNEVGLGDRLQHRPGELSGGEKQRVAIARALITKPKVILADEPTGNLDSKTADEVCNLLLRLQEKNNSLLLLVTHSMSVASKMGLCLEMKQGGELAELLDRPELC